MITFDDILEEVGPFGRSQKRIFALLCLVSLPFSGVYVGIVFQGFTPDHWCRVPAMVDRRQTCGWTPGVWQQWTAPLINVSGEVKPSSCEQYDLDWNSTSLTCDPEDLDLNLTGVKVTTCKDGWEYDYEGRTSLVTEFQLVCSDAWLLDMFQSTLSAGFLVGSFAFGYFADRFGRKRTFLVSNIMNLISGTAVALAPNYISILVFRFIFGFAVKGGWMTCYVLITEMVGLQYRRTVGILFQMFFSIGNILLPLLAYFLSDWRWLQATFTAPYLFFLSYFCFVPESPRWLLSQNQTSSALRVTEAMAKENQRKLRVPDLETLAEEGGDSPSASLLDLVRTPNMRKYTFVLMFNWFTSAVVYQGLVMRVGIAGGNVYLDFFISGMVEFPATFFILFTIERFGRRLPFAFSNIVAGASCIIMVFIPERLFWFQTVMACMGRLGITMSFMMVVFVNTELYPTFIRNQGVSVCSTLCDIGGIVAPFLLYRLSEIWVELPIIIFGIIGIVAGGLVLLLPETKGVPLPETIDDIENPNSKLHGHYKRREEEKLQEGTTEEMKELSKPMDSNTNTV